MAFIDQSAFQEALHPRLATISQHFEAKLWHQLTMELLELVRDPSARSGDSLLNLYRNFVQHIEDNLSQLHLTLIVIASSSQLCPSAPPTSEEADAARAYLAAFRERRGKSLDAAPQLLVEMELALLRVRKAGALARRGDGAGAAAELEGAKGALRGGEVALSRLREGEEPCVPAAFHRASAEYYKLAGPAAACHASTLRYLGCVPVGALPAEERAALALDVALAALVGEGVYDFGEVAQQPILEALAGGPHAWLQELLRALQEGSLAAFAGVVAAHRGALAALPALAAAEAALQEKAALLALCQLVAVRPPEARRVSFAECAAACGVAADKVEHLVMRAVSVGLLKCAIDGVAQEVNFSFIKPKVLSKAQVGALKERVDAWAERVGRQVAEVEASVEGVGQ